KSIPTLGVCLGSQIIAKAAGGKVYKGTKKEIGWYPIELTEDGTNSIFKGLEKSIRVFQWHGDTYDLPKNALTLAESEYYPVQAFRVGSAVGVQFHLEVSKDMVIEWINQYRKELESVSNYISRDAITADLDSNADALKEHAKILYKNFSKMVRSSKMVR
ncbi:MAG: type 1 glutamine amidotransferase, partial [Nitrososphaerales archaeon]